MFQKLGVILNSIILLTSLLVVVCAFAQEDKNIELLKQPEIKQSSPNQCATNSKHPPTNTKLTKALPKDNMVIGSPVISDYTLLSAPNFKSLKPHQLYLQTNNPYINNTNQQIYYLNNKDRLKRERLDKTNTLEKSLGKPMKYDNLNHLPFNINPKGITISPLELIRD